MEEELAALYAATRAALGESNGFRPRPRPFRVAFRPYAGLHAVIYDRRDHYEVRLGELLRAAPLPAHESLARVLLSRIDRRLRIGPEDRIAYRQWAASPDVQARHDAARRSRGRKRFLAPRGTVHDLEALFARLNDEYFQGVLPRPRLGWSLAASRRLYGHHDAAHDAIVINRLLDHPRVPEVVVASILHHEMLHVKHGVRWRDDGRRVMHPRAFKADERRFSGHAEAQRFLRDLEGRRIRLRPARARAPGILKSLQLRFEDLLWRAE